MIRIPLPAVRTALFAAALFATFAASCGPGDVQSPEALAGHWEGNVAWRDATLPVDLDLEMVNGQFVVRAMLLALFEGDVFVENFTYRSLKVRFRLPMGSETWSFEGWFRRNVISGTFSGGSLPLALNRNTLPRLGLQRVPRRAPAGPYRADSVRFAGGSASLAGTVLAPADSLAHPAVVLLGDGESGTRAEVLGLAERFASAGFVALAFDARGCGASAGDANAMLADHELDAVEAAEFLRHREGVDPRRLGFVGRGRGAVLVPRVATRVRTAFAIAISPPGVPLDRAYARLGGQPGWAKAEAHADPAAPWATLAAPSLVLYGERDEALPDEGARRVREALGSSHAGSKVETVAHADHALRLRPRWGEPFDFPRFSPAALDTMLAWACARCGMPPPPPPLVPPAR